MFRNPLFSSYENNEMWFLFAQMCWVLFFSFLFCFRCHLNDNCKCNNWRVDAAKGNICILEQMPRNRNEKELNNHLPITTVLLISLSLVDDFCGYYRINDRREGTIMFALLFIDYSEEDQYFYRVSEILITITNCRTFTFCFHPKNKWRYQTAAWTIEKSSRLWSDTQSHIDGFVDNAKRSKTQFIDYQSNCLLTVT